MSKDRIYPFSFNFETTISNMMTGESIRILQVRNSQKKVSPLAPTPPPEDRFILYSAPGSNSTAIPCSFSALRSSCNLGSNVAMSLSYFPLFICEVADIFLTPRDARLPISAIESLDCTCSVVKPRKAHANAHRGKKRILVSFWKKTSIPGVFLKHLF